MFVILLRVNLVHTNGVCYICTNVAYVTIQERPEKRTGHMTGKKNNIAVYDILLHMY
jgi:hypothetical protein